MPVINSEIDRKTKQEAFWAEGVVEYVKLDKFDELKVSYIKVAGQPDKKIESTHKASILLKEKGAGKDDAGVWIGLGEVKLHPEHENLQVKKDDKWVTIEPGVEVTLDVKLNEWKGKTYYQSSKGKIFIVSTEGVQAAQQATPAKGSQQSSGKTSYKKRDNVGIEVGHCLNGALELKRHGVDGEVFDLAGIVQSATVTLKAEVAAAKGVSADDYDVGASVGHGILNACRDHKGETVSVEELIDGAKGVLEIAGRIEAAIRGNAPVEEKKEPKKTTPKPTKPATPAKPSTPPAPSDEPQMDFDDDIPF